MQTPFTAVPDWFSDENAGASVAVADVDADGRPDVVLLMVDAPPGANAASYRLGRALDDATIDAVADAMTAAVSPVRATLLPPTYRKQMVGVMTRRALREIRDGAAVAVG